MFLTESTSPKVDPSCTPVSILEHIIEFNESFDKDKSEMILIEHEIAMLESAILFEGTEVATVPGEDTVSKQNLTVAKKSFGGKAKEIWGKVVAFIKSLGQKIAGAFRTALAAVTAVLVKLRNKVTGKVMVDDPAAVKAQLSVAIQCAKDLASASNDSQKQEIMEKIRVAKEKEVSKVSIKAEEAGKAADEIKKMVETLDSTITASMKALESKASAAASKTAGGESSESPSLFTSLSSAAGQLGSWGIGVLHKFTRWVSDKTSS
jgi:hypothetical protein